MIGARDIDKTTIFYSSGSTTVRIETVEIAKPLALLDILE